MSIYCATFQYNGNSHTAHKLNFICPSKYCFCTAECLNFILFYRFFVLKQKFVVFANDNRCRNVKQELLL